MRNIHQKKHEPRTYSYSQSKIAFEPAVPDHKKNKVSHIT